MGQSAPITFTWSSGGGIRLESEGVLHRERRDGSQTSMPIAAEVGWPTPVVCVMGLGGESALVGFVRNSLVVHVSSGRDALTRIALGERIPHGEQLEVFAVTGGFLVRLENGLVFVEEAGRDRWRVDRVTFDWRFVGEREGALWLVDEGGNLLGFSLEAGVDSV